jgi:hypothetical protein
MNRMWPWLTEVGALAAVREFREQLESRGSGGASAGHDKRKTESGNEKRASSRVDIKRSKTKEASTAVIMSLLVNLCAAAHILGGPDAPDIMSPDQNIGRHEYICDTSLLDSSRPSGDFAYD